VRAQAYLIEAANARHEHEWAVWQAHKLPEGKILIPGVVTHSTDVVEHPELVAQRLQRFAGVVGRENLIAGADCGFGGRTHPQIAWAKLRALVEGARRAGATIAQPIARVPSSISRRLRSVCRRRLVAPLCAGPDETRRRLCHALRHVPPPVRSSAPGGPLDTPPCPTSPSTASACSISPTTCAGRTRPN
jgi:hypothetical protein